MYHLPRFFNNSSNKQKSISSNSKKRPKPTLDRRNAQKNIDYHPPAATGSSIIDEYSVRARSLDVPPYIDRKSFRVEGTDGEIDLICETLGLSGPDDLGISVAAWEARRVRSASDAVVPGPRLNDVSEVTHKISALVRVNDVGEEGEVNIVKLNDCSTTDGLTYNNHNNGGGRGIKGVRPPVLTPPPVSAMPIIDSDCSTWELLSKFAPDGGGFVYKGGFGSDNDEGFNGGCSERENAVLSGCCSFTTSNDNDDDSSSTTTEPPSNISPQGRVRRFISCLDNWEKGKLLGRGSFGSVYEGIAE